MTFGKACLTLAGSVIVALAAVADVTVTNVSCRQRWPWNDLIDIDFTLSGTSAAVYYIIDVAARYPGVAGEEIGAKHLTTEPIAQGDGHYRISWDLAKDAPGLVTTNFSVRVSATPLDDSSPVYMVIDMSAGPGDSSRFPIRYTARKPDLTKDTCRTTEMWLRRCPAGSFSMGCADYKSWKYAWAPHTVTLTKPFYIGIFECTQQQWYQVMGTWPSFYTNAAHRATRPVENITFRSDIRGNAGWENNDGTDTRVGAGTFVAKMRTATGLQWLDVPTESQWEYACRAGLSCTYCWPEVTSATIAQYARCSATSTGKTVNVEDGSVGIDQGTAKVGSYPANNWGIYDMLGNVSELCGDSHVRNWPDQNDGYDFTDPRMDPANPKYYSARVARGGSIGDGIIWLSCYNRWASTTSTENKSRLLGFRIVVTDK